jgi:LmbE family N-acetylglucosaminyl deacetylase
MPTEQEKQWIEAWRIAGPALERIRNEELRNLSDEEGTRKATLLGVPAKLMRPRESQLHKLHQLLARLQQVG